MSDPRLIAKGKKTRERILVFILVYRSQKGYSPTIREIRDGSGVKSESTVEHHLNRLEREGSIERDRKVARSIRVSEEVVKLMKISLRRNDVQVWKE